MMCPATITHIAYLDHDFFIKLSASLVVQQRILLLILLFLVVSLHLLYGFLLDVFWILFFGSVLALLLALLLSLGLITILGAGFVSNFNVNISNGVNILIFYV